MNKRRVVLESITAEYFKGLKDLTMEFSDGVNVVSGPNASGKTSILDCFLWIVSDKDSTGRSSFAIRMKDESGKDIDNVEIVGQAVMRVDDERVTFRKVQKQRWTKKRGSSAPTYEGNENIYMIDGFPVKRSEYAAKIDSIVKENIFQIITDIFAFSRLPWQEKRKTALLFVPEVTDADILDTDPDRFSLIADDVRIGGVDKTKEKNAATMKKLKDEQKAYPVRIDEAIRQVVEVDVDALTAKRKKAEADLEETLKIKANLESALADVSALQQEIVSTKIRMTEIETAEREAVMKSQYASQKAYEDARAEVRALTDQYNRTASALDISESAMKMNLEDYNHTKEEYDAVKARTLPADATVCPTCQRTFPEEKIAEIRAGFAERRRADMTVLVDRGKRLKKAIDDAIPSIDRMKADCARLKADIAEKMAQVDALKAVYESAPKEVDLSTSESYTEAQRRLEELQGRLMLMDDGKARKDALDEAERGVRRTIQEIDTRLAVVDANKRAEQRVAELRAEQLDCSQKIADVERALDLLDAFMRLKMTMLTDRINSKFKYVRFRLFDELINGAITPTCVIQVNSNGSWVDYTDGNHAAQILGGLDIINALSDLYGVSAPVFIDNAEALDHNNIPETDSQLILLKVTDDEALKIERG